LFLVGKPLKEVYEIQEQYLKFIANSKQHHQLNLVKITAQVVEKLISDDNTSEKL